MLNADIWVISLWWCIHHDGSVAVGASDSFPGEDTDADDDAELQDEQDEEETTKRVQDHLKPREKSQLGSTYQQYIIYHLSIKLYWFIQVKCYKNKLQRKNKKNLDKFTQEKIRMT